MRVIMRKKRSNGVDFTREEGERIIKILFGDQADKVLQGRWQAIKSVCVFFLGTEKGLTVDPVASGSPSRDP